MCPVSATLHARQACATEPRALALQESAPLLRECFCARGWLMVPRCVGRPPSPPLKENHTFSQAPPWTSHVMELCLAPRRPQVFSNEPNRHVVLWCGFCPRHTLVVRRFRQKTPPPWSKAQLCWHILSTAQPACESYPAGFQGLSPNQNRLCFSQSTKGFLESYEEMLSYALRPETWATTRLELEGRGVSWLVSSFLGPTELRSFWWELVPSSTCMLSS